MEVVEVGSFLYPQLKREPAVRTSDRPSSNYKTYSRGPTMEHQKWNHVSAKPQVTGRENKNQSAPFLTLCLFLLSNFTTFIEITYTG